jgi:hypothetical protein
LWVDPTVGAAAIRFDRDTRILEFPTQEICYSSQAGAAWMHTG